MKHIAKIIYCFSYMQLFEATLFATLLVALVVMVHLMLRKAVRYKRTLSILYWCIVIGYILSVIVPITMTLLTRNYGDTRAVTPYPGRMLYHYFVLGEEEGMRVLLVNMALFVPLGSFTAALACCRRKFAFQKKQIIKGLYRLLVAAFLFSLLLEIGQFILACGESEVDDLICNTLGAGIGYLLVHFWLLVITRVTRGIKAVIGSRKSNTSEEPPHNDNKNQ